MVVETFKHLGGLAADIEAALLFHVLASDM